MIKVIDYHKGNIRSVVRGLEAAGAEVEVIDSPDGLRNADAIVLPGVGAFNDAMNSLDELSLTAPIKQAISDGVPFLGICLGMHLLFEGGEEHAPNGIAREGLGVLPGVVKLMPNASHEFKLPHIGWNTVEFATSSPDSIFDGVYEGEHFYFVHSYISPESDYTIATTNHAVKFPSAVHKDNVWGMQFHPEKSSAAGAQLLKNFVNDVRKVQRG